jgi:hypothetical protein
MKNLTGIYWIKNEARYIPEYVEFHLLQGFDHFIFYDNKSDDNLLEVISPYIEAGLVEIRYYPPEVNSAKNYWVMDYCIAEQKNKTKWLHFHALDERLFCPTGQNLVEFLAGYENYGGVSVAWNYFNSNGHVERPDGLIIDNFTTAIHDRKGCHIKTVIQPKYAVTTIGTPHNFRYADNKISVDENYNQVHNSHNFQYYSYNKIKLHHYVTLSKEEFEVKMNKGVLDEAGLKYSEDARRSDADYEWNKVHEAGIESFEDKSLTVFSQTIKNNIVNRYKNKTHLLECINH